MPTMTEPKVELIDTPYRVYLPDGSIGGGNAMLAKQPSLRALHGIIDPILAGGDLEHVSVLAKYHPVDDLRILDMFVDENGHLKGLPRNELATEHYRRATLMGRTRSTVPSDPEELDFVVGPAILFSRKVWF